MPKALVEIGGRPILWHVIEIYAAQGFERFVLCTGYLGEMIERVRRRRSAGRTGSRSSASTPALDTPTGGRDLAAAEIVSAAGRSASPTPTGSPTSTSGPLLDFHRPTGRLATVTVVRPNLQWGVAQLDDDDRVEGFDEKPRTDHWINGGFFCFEPGVARLPRRGQRARARAAGAARRRRPAARPTATRASGTAWTPTRTPSCSTTSGQAGEAPWRAGAGRSGRP